MKYCSSCGTQVQEGVAYCPNCGSPMNAQDNNVNINNDNQQNVNTYTDNNQQNNANVNVDNQPNYNYQNNNQNMGGRPTVENRNIGLAIVLSIVTCGIYGIVWFYNAGKRMFNAGQRYNVQISDNSTLYLILSIFGLQIVDYCLVQADLNKFSAQ